MRDSPIGIFDSGIGGLTVLRALNEQLPHEHMVYLGDTKNLPYGEKSREAVLECSQANARFLLKHSVKLLLIACNTASAFAFESLQEQLSIPVLSVIEPAVEEAVQQTKNGRIGVIGTNGTIASKVYEKQLLERLPSCKPISVACPSLVPLIEEHLVAHEATTRLLEHYLHPLLEQKIDCLILGCTHYPLLEEQIQSMVGDRVVVINSAKSSAEKVSLLMSQYGLNRESVNRGERTYYVSDDVQKFQRSAGFFLNESITPFLIDFLI